jgi:tight adherence protein B
VTGVLLGLLAGLGAALVVSGATGGVGRPSVRPRSTSSAAIRDRLVAAELQRWSPRHLYGACLAVGLAVTSVVAATSRSVVVGLAFGCFAAYVPIAVVTGRARRRRADRRDVWPDVVDNLASAVRAGLALPEALTQIGERGPTVLRPAFLSFGEDYRASGRFDESLDRLKERLADPVADRIAESMRIARDVGGTDLGRLLRSLSQFLRDDARTRAELVARQGWTVNAARLALTSPWAVLALLSLRPETVAAYDSPAGVAVLVVGGAVSLIAYRLMLAIARLPDEERVLR